MRKLFSKLFFKYLIVFIGILLATNVITTIIMLASLMNEYQTLNPFLFFLENQPPMAAVVVRTGFVTFAIGTILIFVITLSIISPIKKLINASKKVADGDFTIVVPEKGHDEITELTHNFNKMIKELSANEYLHKDFVSNVSHEFKTPITSLKGYAVLLKQPNLTEEKRSEYADIIIAESERLSKLSTNLLRLSELEVNVIALKKEAFSLDEQIRDVLLLLQNQWEKQSIELDLELDEVKFIGDKALIYQVWLNLIDNAIKYSNYRGKIKIILNKSEKINVTIKDNGIGMSSYDCENIFRRFYMADKSRNTSGTGLGLPIVQRIIELHSGSISVVSDSEKGSCFIVSL